MSVHESLGVQYFQIMTLCFIVMSIPTSMNGLFHGRSHGRLSSVSGEVQHCFIPPLTIDNPSWLRPWFKVY